MISVRMVSGVAAAVGLAVGLALGWWLRGGDDRKPPAPAAVAHRAHGDSADFDAALAAIRDDLAFERNARVALAVQMERKIEQLHQTFAQRATVSATQRATGSAAQGPANPAASNAGTLGDPSSPELEGRGEIGEIWFSDEALLEHGIPLQEVQSLRERYEETELEARYLRDRATREGWISNSRFGQTIRSMQEELRELVGDEGYDQILYATGKRNRVRLKDALLQSAATAAGILAGDVIVSYAGKRVFDPTTLYLWSTEGAAGKRTEIEISRDGEIIRYFVPRGPLGARFSHERVPPGS